MTPADPTPAPVAPAAPAAPAAPDRWRRLHPIALVTPFVGMCQTIGWLVVIAFVTGGWSTLKGRVLFALAGVVLVVSPFTSVARWLATRYRLTDDSLEFRSGLFFRSRRAIGYDRIHAIDGTTPVWMRPFAVVRLTVSAGGDESDITLDAVPAILQLELESRRDTAARITDDATDTDINARPTVTELPETTGIARPADATQPVFRASTRDILLFAITDIGFLAAALAAWGVIQQYEDFVPDSWRDAAVGAFDGIVARGLLSIALLAVVCMIVLAAASVVASMLRFHGFEVWRRGDDLVIARGLLTRRTVTLPVSRIQTVVVRQSLLRRPLHLCSVEVGLSTVNAGDESGDEATARSRILPVVGTGRVWAILATMLPEWDLHEPTIRHTGRGLTRYFLTMPLAVGAIATACAAVAALMIDAVPWWLMMVPAAVGLLWASMRFVHAREEGYDLGGGSSDEPDRTGARQDRIAVAGATRWTRTVTFTRRQRVQSFTRTTTLWRERRGVERVGMPRCLI
ncbi:PH domain-containing protein [Bifidobacterium samirii]|uniref:Bacterial PH domain-containing protein n=1 Tax=Bifidobacterium samirii TaxID=2306974 RepID=A0A430FR37_9BIFI|nr:PH domain-containing protein [Bifidobacterium samirii]RSX55299.1 Bacterial PH domain-containing protein [Bifidobacterium samirii]